MQNFKDHHQEITAEFVDLYFAKYMKGEWGIEVGYNPYPQWWVDYRMTLCDFQMISDYGSLCTESQTSGF